MEVKVIQVGQEFESFNAFWRASGFTNYQNKDSQRRELKRYYDWVEVKNGKSNKIIVTEVYTLPKEKVNNTGKSDGSRRNNVIYQDDKAIVIEHFLASSKKKVFKGSISTLALNCNIISKDYLKCKYDEDDFFEKSDNFSNRTALENTMFNLNSTLKNGMFGALKLLQKQNKIEYEYVTFVEILDKLDITTKEMDMKLKNIEEKVLEELKVEN